MTGNLIAAAAYDDVAEAYHEWVGASLADPSLSALLGDVRGQRVCALACGQGRDARYLADRGAQVIGLDISARLLRLARQLTPVPTPALTYLLASATDLPVAPASVDGVLCHMALMDIPDLGATISGAARILRPGGWFVFAITHPCFKAPATGEITDHVDGSVRRTVGRYFDEGYWHGPGAHAATLPVGAYHRTLSSYVNCVAGAGLVIEQMMEPVGVPDGPVWHQVPCLLYMRCRREGR
jgi:ubiquinone/menaquinone biosynthesis C-methylase UbiE